ncbi:MAG: hypothetical protein R3C62_00530 [Chloroflexota bacterium]
MAYCYRHLADYDFIYWLPADEPPPHPYLLVPKAGIMPPHFG